MSIAIFVSDKTKLCVNVDAQHAKPPRYLVALMMIIIFEPNVYYVLSRAYELLNFVVAVHTFQRDI